MRENNPVTDAELSELEDKFNARLQTHGVKAEVRRDGVTVVRVDNADPDRRLRELKAARKRVGTTPTLHLRWLLNFANGVPPQDGETARRVSAELTELVQAACDPGVITEHKLPKLGSPEQIDHLQQVHAGLREEILAPAMYGRWTVKSCQLGNYEFGVDRGTPFYSGDEGALFVLACHQLLASPEARRISRCAFFNCDRWFLRRKRGIYCSPECGAEAKSARYFATPVEERSERRHQAYKNSVTSRLGKRIKVHRRGPRAAKENSDVQID